MRRDLVERWRTEADLLLRRGAPDQAHALQACADELEQHIAAWELEGLTVAEAAAETGYSPAQLRRLFPGQKRIPRTRLPRKAHPDGPDLAAQVLAQRALRRT